MKFLVRFRCPLLGRAEDSSQQLAIYMVSKWLADRSAELVEVFILENGMIVQAKSPNANLPLLTPRGLSLEHVAMELVEAMPVERVVQFREQSVAKPVGIER